MSRMLLLIEKLLLLVPSEWRQDAAKLIADLVEEARKP